MDEVEGQEKEGEGEEGENESSFLLRHVHRKNTTSGLTPSTEFKVSLGGTGKKVYGPKPGTRLEIFLGNRYLTYKRDRKHKVVKFPMPYRIIFPFGYPVQT